MAEMNANIVFDPIPDETDVDFDAIQAEIDNNLAELGEIEADLNDLTADDLSDADLVSSVVADRISTRAATADHLHTAAHEKERRLHLVMQIQPIIENILNEIINDNATELPIIEDNYKIFAKKLASNLYHGRASYQFFSGVISEDGLLNKIKSLCKNIIRSQTLHQFTYPIQLTQAVADEILRPPCEAAIQSTYRRIMK